MLVVLLLLIVDVFSCANISQVIGWEGWGYRGGSPTVVQA